MSKKGKKLSTEEALVEVTKILVNSIFDGSELYIKSCELKAERIRAEIKYLEETRPFSIFKKKNEEIDQKIFDLHMELNDNFMNIAKEYEFIHSLGNE